MHSSVVTFGALITLILAGAPVAHAESEDLKLSFGLRAGYGLPLGTARGGEGHYNMDLDEVVKGIVPAQLDVGTFLGSRVYVGASFQYAVGLAVSSCQGDCGVSAMRIGLNLSYHHPWSEKLSPWVGLGVGYDFLDADQLPSITTGQLEPTSSYGRLEGFEVGNVQGGIDLNVAGPVWFGPYVTGTLSRYDGPDARFHSWFMGGLRLLVRR
ncbi:MULTISPECIES: hypothetical protein [Myxococcus]|uniref:hypothetical protein n=1 Tax=Myxococcus TaxID=32 RepID=UPI0013D42CA3|nr:MULTISPECIES: hypothetical protein [Myxococcus]NVJ25629.1 hypothetical protein [Myxococcus sp. AM011]